MNEYDRALELETVSLESAGSAMEKYGIYIESTEAKINKMKTSFTELANASISSSFTEFFITLITNINEVLSLAGGLLPVLGLAGGAFLIFKTHIFSTTLALNGLQAAFGVVGIAMAAISLIGGVVTGIINANKKALEEKIVAVDKEISKTNEQIDTTQKLKDEYISLMAVENKTEVESEKLAKIKEKLIKIYGEEANALDLVNGKYEEQTGKIRDKQNKEQEKLKEKLERKNSLLEEQEKKNLAIDKSSAKKIIADFVHSPHKKNSFNAKLKENLVNKSGIKDKFEGYSEASKMLMDKQKKEGLSKEEEVMLKDINSELAEIEPRYNELMDNITKIEEATKKVNFNKQMGASIDAFSLESVEFLNMSLEDQARIYKDLERSVANLYKQDNAKEFTSEIDAITEAYKKQVEVLKKTDFALIGMDAQLKALEKEKKILEEEQKIRDAELKQQEKLLAVEKAREELAKAKDKRIKVFRAGKGFVYEEDFSEVENAQKNLDSAIKDAQVSDKSPVDKAMEGVKKLEEMYNRVIVEGTTGEDKKVDDKTIREWFLDEEFRKQFENMEFADKQKFLEQFLKLGDWAKTEESLKEERLNNIDKWIPQYANGTMNAEGGVSLVGEKGAEMRVLNKGDKIIPNGLTNKIINMAKNPSEYLKSNSDSSSSTTNYNIARVVLENVQNAKGFFDEMSKLRSPTRSLT